MMTPNLGVPKPSGRALQSAPSVEFELTAYDIARASVPQPGFDTNRQQVHAGDEETA